MTKSDDWDFKVEVDEKESDRKVEEAPRVKASALAHNQRHKSLKLDEKAYVSREERLKKFKAGIEEKSLDNLKIAAIDKRVKAQIIDNVFVIIGYFILSQITPLMQLVSSFELKEIETHALLGNLAFFLLHVIPCAKFKQSLGKKIFKIRIGDTHDDYGASFLAIVWRETIAKSLSILSILGLLIAFSNKQKRTLHDFLSGSVVYDET